MALFRWDSDIKALLFSTRRKNAYLTPPGFYPIRCYAFAFATLGPALRVHECSGTLDAQGGKKIVSFYSTFSTNFKTAVACFFISKTYLQRNPKHI
jgi:hypothetical protein